MFDDRLDIFIKVLWETNLSLEDILVDDHRILIRERVYPSVHLVDEDAQSPPVNSLPVTLIQQNLWSQVLWSSTQCIGSSFYYLRETEVSEFQVAVLCNQ